MKDPLQSFFGKPAVGSTLTVLAGVCFFFTCMLLPLVGRTGSHTPHADKNQLTFLSVLSFTFLVAALATWSKMMRRSVDHSPFPFWSFGLCVVCALLFFLQLAGLLAI